MQIKHEVKGQLARLLATEDLIVEHRSVDTASFNVGTRVLTLPTWDNAGEEVYDTLVCHEVGHALYTPDDEWWLYNEISASIVNIVEDARIEKLMKRRYGGLSKTFFRGYSSLSEDDFFKLEGKDLTKFNLADRINLYYKVGNFTDIPFFSNEETFLMNRTGLTETFDDVLEVAKLIFEYCKTQAEKQKAEEANMQADEESEGSLENNSMSGQSNEEPSMEEEGSGEDSEEQEMEVTQSGGSNTTSGIQGGEESGEIEATTDEMFTDSLKELSNLTSNETNYVEVPEVNLKQFIIDNQKIHNDMNTEWEGEEKKWKEEYLARLAKNPNIAKFYESHFGGTRPINPLNIFENVDADFAQFKKDAQKEVNYLVKEFECKKSAAAYARATTSRTGILNTTLLHTYKFNEDLFKKVSVIPDGKNHGLIFLLDWSGSMQNVLMDTIKQLFNLVWFCKKVNIPFEVYAFTNTYPTSDRGEVEQKNLTLHMDSSFSLMNLLTSKIRVKDMNTQMRNIFRLAKYFDSRGGYYNCPIGMNLSGTPLNEAMICLHQILPQFQKENGLEKVQCVVLTDGESQPIRFNRELQRDWESRPYMGTSYLSGNCFLRNRKTGHVYACKEDMGYYGDVTGMLLEDLCQSFPDTNFIGIRIMPSSWGSSFIRKYETDEVNYKKDLEHWRKHKSVSLKGSGYHVYFGLSSTALGNDTEFEVQEDATKAQIKRAFNKSLKGKKMNKKILGEFIELVA
jgi:hypothetical protein